MNNIINFNNKKDDKIFKKIDEIYAQLECSIVKEKRMCPTHKNIYCFSNLYCKICIKSLDEWILNWYSPAKQ